MAYKFQLGNFTASGSIDVEGVVDGKSGLEISGSVVKTTVAELNVVRTVHTPETVTIADGDGLVLNDVGSGMKQATVQSLAAYLDDEITAMPNLSSAPALATIGAAAVTTNIASGDVTMFNPVNDGNPTIQIGKDAAEQFSIQALYDSGAQTLDKVIFQSKAASGTAHKGQFEFTGDEVQVLGINDSGLGIVGAVSSSGPAMASGFQGETLGHRSDTDMIDLEPQLITLANDVDFNIVKASGLKLEGVAVTAGAAELNLLDDVTGLVKADFTKLAGVDASANELNLMDGDSSIGTTAVSDGHGIVMNHGGTMAQTTVQTLAAYLDDEITAMPNLVSSALTTVGALANGSIAAGFGSIDNGNSNITTGGLLKLDIDFASAPSNSQKVTGQAGTLTLGASGAGAIGVDGDHLFIENSVDTKDIIFRVDGGGDNNMLAMLKVGGMGAHLSQDDKALHFGADDDYAVQFKNADSSLEVKQDVEGAAFKMSWIADQGDNDEDHWQWQVADQGVMTLSSKIGGSYAAQMTMTPNSTPAASTVAVAGHLTAGGNLTVTGDLTINGTTTTINSTELSVDDRIIRIGDGLANLAAGVTQTAGFEIGANLASFKLNNDVGGSNGFLSSLPIKASGFVGALTGDVTGTSSKVAVTDSSAGSNFDMVFHNGSSELLEDDGAFHYNPSTGTLTAAKFSGALEGSMSETVQAINASAGLNPASGTIITSDATNGNVVITLPAANASSVSGKVLKFKRVDASNNTVTIHTAADSDTIDGGHAIVLESARAAVSIFSDGSNAFYVM